MLFTLIGMPGSGKTCMSRALSSKINIKTLDTDRVIEARVGKKLHEIILSDFEQTEHSPLVTIAGVSNEARCAYITGQGSRTAKFLLYHFDRRIAELSPDIFLLILGGNDFVYYGEDEYKEHLTELFERMTSLFPACELYTLTIPPSAKPEYKIRGMSFASEEEFNAELEKYNAVLEELSLKYGAKCLRLRELFDGMSPELWRYDEVHLSSVGNDMLYKKICEIIGL